MAEHLNLQPLVSVVIITYNRAHLIEESLRSVMVQTYENWELIIIDDGSDDETEEVIKKLKSPKMRYYKTTHSGRLGKLRNCGIKMAFGEYIAFQDSDDLWLPRKLEVQLDLLKKFPDAVFVLSSSSQFGENATQVPEYDSLYMGNLFLPILKEKRFHFCGTSLLFRKHVAHKVGLLDEENRMMRELHFFLCMSAMYQGVFTNERLVKVRRHAKNTSNSYYIEAHKTTIEMLEDFLKKGFLSRKLFKELTSESLYNIGIEQLKRSHPSSAAKFFLKSTILDPFNWRNPVRLFQAFVFSSKNLLYKTAAAPGATRK